MKHKLIFLTVLLTALSAFPAEYFVDASRPNDTGGATNWATAKKTIQAAVDLTVDGDTVWVTNGVYDTGGAVAPNESISSRVLVVRNVLVKSTGGAEVTTIIGLGPLGSNAVRCVFLSENAVLDGFTLTGGYTSDQPAALLDDGVPIDRIGLSDTSAIGGGVVLCMDAKLANCIIVSNTSCRAGGGIYFNGGGESDGCLVAENQTGQAKLVNFQIVGSDVTNWITQVFLGDGGGAYMNGGGMVKNCTFSSNATRLDVWGLFNNTFISGGGGSGKGGGLFCEGGVVENCIVADNTAIVGRDVNVGEYAESTFRNNLTGAVLVGQGNITNAPLFVDAANGNFRLQSNSPCINWGNNSVVSNTTDLAGNPRIVEGVVDMGAYEYQEVIGLADSDNDGINDDWERSHGGNQNPERTCSNGVNTILQAYIAGLDPHDPADKFSFLVDRSTPFGNVLRWQNVAGREYAVYYSTNLLNGFIPLIEHLVTGSGTYIDEVYEYDGPRYYKIDVQIDDNPDDNVTPPSPFI